MPGPAAEPSRSEPAASRAACRPGLTGVPRPLPGTTAKVLLDAGPDAGFTPEPKIVAVALQFSSALNHFFRNDGVSRSDPCDLKLQVLD